MAVWPPARPQLDGRTPTWARGLSLSALVNVLPPLRPENPRGVAVPIDSRRQDCHSAAPLTTLSRCFNGDGERASAQWQSRQGLRCQLESYGASRPCSWLRDLHERQMPTPSLDLQPSSSLCRNRCRSFGFADGNLGRQPRGSRRQPIDSAGLPADMHHIAQNHSRGCGGSSRPMYLLSAAHLLPIGQWDYLVFEP